MPNLQKDLRTETVTVPGYELVTYGENARVGLKSFIAIHNSSLGPACGGTRLWPYATREDALDDVLRLAKGMSYKSALAGIGFGGGKSVLIAEPSRKSPELLQAFGEFVDTLGGRYIAAVDMNINEHDLVHIRKGTRHVVGVAGAPGSSGDPSPVTARGVLRAMEATAEVLFGSKQLSGVKVAIQGVGSVGYRLGQLLHERGAQLWITDTSPEAVKRAVGEFGATAVALDEIYSAPVDIFAPCARGSILHEDTISQLKCKAVVGAANNQLRHEKDGMRLYERGILYAPDFAINAGGIVNLFVEYEGYDANRAFKITDATYETLKQIYRRAQEQRLPPFVVADKLAEEKLRAAK